MFTEVIKNMPGQAAWAPKDASFRLAFEQSNIAMCLVSQAGRLLTVNDQMCKLFGYGKAEFEGMRVVDLAHPDSKKVSPSFYQGIQTGNADLVEFEKDYMHQQGHVVHAHVSRSLVRNAAGEALFYVAHVADITQRKKMEEDFLRLAFYDPLTKLANRRLLNDRLAQTLISSKRFGWYGALLFLDLDNFKPLNDAQGHHVGDLLLMEVADRIKACVREVDTVARFGGDEFVVLLTELEVNKTLSNSYAGMIAEKIRVAVSRPYQLTTLQQQEVTLVEHQCTASIGVALFSGKESRRDDILRGADSAMYEAKEAGRNSVRFQ